jgi:hypothetical protein
LRIVRLEEIVEWPRIIHGDLTRGCSYVCQNVAVTVGYVPRSGERSYRLAAQQLPTPHLPGKQVATGLGYSGFYTTSIRPRRREATMMTRITVATVMTVAIPRLSQPFEECHTIM